MSDATLTTTPAPFPPCITTSSPLPPFLEPETSFRARSLSHDRGGTGGLARDWKTGIVAHEMLHLLYWEFFTHARIPPNPADPQERRRNSAHCYKAFILK